MAGERSIELLRSLSEAAGPPGAEDEVRAIVHRTLEPVGPIRHDRLGSVLCERRGSSGTPRVVLDSHLDEVGFLVQSVSDEGKLSLVPLGTWWSHVLLGQRVDILAERGRVAGVIGATPPHFLSADARKSLLSLDDMYVDLGASSRADVAAAGVAVGDPIVPHTRFQAMPVDDVVSGKAFDDRVGVALMCETMLALGDRDHPNTVIGVGAVQEELGSRGAGTATELSRPDVAIVLEGTPADDVPGKSQRQGAMGRGPQVRLFDPTAVANRRLAKFCCSVAEECEIEIQVAVRKTGGTDAATIHRSGAGVPAVVIGVPVRYIHSHVSLLHMEDYRSARSLLLELVARLDTERVATFARFA
jgi:endoglucanase